MVIHQRPYQLKKTLTLLFGVNKGISRYERLKYLQSSEKIKDCLLHKVMERYIAFCNNF
jgi:hypothetical protein